MVVNHHLGWRWTEYIEAIWTFAILTVTLFFLPETYAPVLLKRKAQRLRKETGNERWFHPQEKIKLSPKTIITKHFSRPILMLITEPMVTCIALYASFVYALLYMTLEVFPIVFQENRKYSPVVGSLPFLGLFVGVCAAIGINLANQPRYARMVDAAGGKPVPEGRCAPMAVGGILFAIGLFWFGWTANPSIPCMWPSTYPLSLPDSYCANNIHRACVSRSSRVYRGWFQHYLPAMYQLLNRYIPIIRCKCSVCKYLPTKHFGSCISTSSNAYVP